MWQQALQLEDWKISLVMSHRSDLRPGTLGSINWDADKKTARIRVLDAAEYPTSFETAIQDMEFTVVHELIHLELASLPRTDASRPDEEHAVNRIADALLRLDALSGDDEGEALRASAAFAQRSPGSSSDLGIRNRFYPRRGLAARKSIEPEPLH